MAYATNDDVFQLALTAQAFVVRPRPVELIDAATGTLQLTAHGLGPLDLVRSVLTVSGTLPSELSQVVYYSPVIVGGDLIRLALAPGGAPITFAAPGASWSIAVDPYRRLANHLEDNAAIIDENLTAEAPPIRRDSAGKYPQILVGMNARMAARSTVTSLQIENASYRVAVDRLFALEARDNAILADWKAGKPINVRPPDQTTTQENAAKVGFSRAPAGWSTGYL